MYKLPKLNTDLEKSKDWLLVWEDEDRKDTEAEQVHRGTSSGAADLAAHLHYLGYFSKIPPPGSQPMESKSLESGIGVVIKKYLFQNF